ncbi:hypothetical protein K5L82_10080 [Marinobacter sp. AL4B]|nr:hypothetical protein [Marinobacter sp. AL4B]
MTVFVLASLLGVNASVSAAVQVDQTPLTVSEPLPPNIVLLHDDSGSMGYNYLPDTASTSGDDFRKFSKNRQYYNPETLYAAPPKADGSFYSAATFPDGYVDPFNSNNKNNIISDSDYSETTITYSNSYNSANGCEDNGGKPRYYKHRGRYYYYDCEFVNGHFVYFDGNAKNHVVKDGDSCAGLSNCHHASDALEFEVDGETISTTYGQNVANYYSYYRTRKLAAKSGIMAAFSELDPKFRFGYGSINNSNLTGFTESNSYTKHMTIKKVESFGDGSNGTNKAKFWSWLNGVDSDGGTPLRRALESAGEYYKTPQPWTESGKEYACRASYTILVSDGYWSGSAPSSSLKRADNTSTDNYDAVAPFTGGNSLDRESCGWRCSRNVENATLADVANYYWKTDLRTASDEVSPTANDPATWQHMTTFTVGLGLEVSGLGATQAELFNWARGGRSVENWGGWPVPGNGGGSGESENVSDMLHAAINGHGNFFSARDPKQFADGIKQALADIAATPGAGSSPFVGGGEYLTNETTQYAASYMTGSWSGELKATKYSKTDGEFNVPLWNAASMLPSADQRNIWTMKVNGDAVEFKHDDQSPNLTDYLSTLGNNIYPSDAKGADWGKRIVSYLRGDKVDENTGVFRKRDSLLGDIVNSTPVVIESPTVDLYEHVIDDTYFEGLTKNKKKLYNEFAADNSSRTPMLYVAANDGMLHAFNADTGVEKFAYIPRALLRATGDGSLARLANPEYGVINPVDGSQPVPHQYYNDGKLTIQNVYLDDEWKTILVGTTGRGQSRTVYALDITDPAVLADPAKAEDAILWERSAGDGEANSDWIGMALGKPTISLIKGSGNKGKWVAHLGNGPNSAKGKAALLQFDLADGTLSVYKAGSMNSNGLAAPYVIQSDDSDGVSEYAFAGDLQGNVWQFDLSSSGKDVSDPIYIAMDSSGKRQPITADMLATKNEETGAIWVFFGTGRFLSKNSDVLADSGVQTWYGLRALAGPSGYAEVVKTHSRGNLQKRDIIYEDEKVQGGGVFRVTSTGQFSDLTDDGKVGWYMDLVSPVASKGEEGERIVYQTQLIAGRLMVNTLIPESSNPCNTSPEGATLIVDPFSGANPAEALLDADGDTDVDNDDSVNIKGTIYFFNSQRYEVGVSGTFTAKRDGSGNIRLFGQGLDAGFRDIGTTGGASAGNVERLNWHEIVN